MTPAIGRHAVEALCLSLPVVKISGRNYEQWNTGEAGLRRHMIERHQPVGLIEGQRLQQHGIYHAKNRRVRPDPEREHQHRDRGEARILAEHPQTVANVLPEICHGLLITWYVNSRSEVRGTTPQIKQLPCQLQRR